MSKPTDTEMLNWLDEQRADDSDGWVCRRLGVGYGFSVLQTRAPCAHEILRADIRLAIAAAMAKQRKDNS